MISLCQAKEVKEYRVKSKQVKKREIYRHQGMLLVSWQGTRCTRIVIILASKNGGGSDVISRPLYTKNCVFGSFFFFFGCQTGESEGSEKAIRRTARPKTRWIFEPVDLKRKAAYRMAP